MTEIIVIIMSIILVDNVVLSQFLGICPFLGVSKKMDSAVGMGVAVTFVMVLATAATWPVQKHRLSADRCVHPDHRGSGAAGGNDAEEVYAAAV